ncbi:hypothetical protein ILYODFUR_029511 [Ilyodon furcidens]|uniref:Uncharacterized protein n=1 Tax=Ilyodon furcidens TaxID=33524 RepID=A0ABV0U1N0_9TELE
MALNCAAACAYIKGLMGLQQRQNVTRFGLFLQTDNFSVLLLLWRHSAPTLETRITSATSAKPLKTGNISPIEVFRSQQDSQNKGFSDMASTLLQQPCSNKELINLLTRHQVVRVVNCNL